ncbi:MAG: hypothetical protein ABI867_20245 [Kofleriaceae bacterium]
MRIARCSIPGILTHIIVRFVDGTWFLQSSQERTKYLGLFGRAMAHTDWRCLAYALMSNHLHFALIAGELPLEGWAKRVHSPFARWLNWRHDRLGPVVADRPAEWAMDPINETRVIPYLHNNPVRAHVVERAADSNWTSHLAYVGLAPRPAWLHVELGMAMCGFESEQHESFDQWVAERSDIQLEQPPLNDVRTTARRHGALEIGTPLVTATTEVPLVVRPDTNLRPSMLEMIAIAVRVTATDRSEICSRTARPTSVSARRVAIHSARRMGLTFGEIAAGLGISQQAVARHGDTILNATQAEAVDAILHRARRALGYLR